MLSLFLISHSGGQLEAQSFTDELTTESTRQYPAGGSDTVILEQFDKHFLESDQAYIGLEPDSRWQIMFTYSYEWEEIVGRPADISYDPDHNERSGLTTKRYYYQAAVFDSDELTDGLNIPLDLQDSGKKPYRDMPLFYDRGAPRNGVWIPIRSGDYLMMRLAHNYPNGNMTSFYREYRFYFKKLK